MCYIDVDVGLTRQSREIRGTMDRDAKSAVIIWVAASIAAFATVSYDFINTKRLLGLIMNDPGTTAGRWTSKDCSNHASRQYTFSVDRVPYHGSGGPGDPDCDSVSLGAAVSVAYERANPANNFAGQIEDIPNVVANHKVSFVFPLLWSIGVFFLFVRPHLRKRK